MTTSGSSCDLLFPGNGPRRFIQGTVLMLMGSLAWLIAQFVDLHFIHKDARDNDDLEQVTYITGVATGCLVAALSAMAILVHCWCIRHMRLENQKALAYDQEKADEAPELTFWEWFFYPELVPILPERRSKTVKYFCLVYRQLSWDYRHRFSLLAPTMALYLVLMMRLFAGADNFEGYPAYLDFGWTNGILPAQESGSNVFANAGDEFTIERIAEKSSSFTYNYQSYGNASYGFFSALLAFPVVQQLLLGNNFLPFVNRFLVHVVPWILSLFPTTYLLAQRMRISWDTFANSTFAGPALEWTAGFLAALSLGNLGTAMVMYHRLKNLPFDEESEGTSSDDTDASEDKEVIKDKQSPPWYKFWLADDEVPNDEEVIEAPEAGPLVKLFQTLIGMVLWLTVFGAAVMFGLTWNGCVKGSNEDSCVNYSPDGKRANNQILVIFCLIPTLAWLSMIIMKCRRGEQ